jgi:hypothetical protein
MRSYTRAFRQPQIGGASGVSTIEERVAKHTWLSQRSAPRARAQSAARHMRVQLSASVSRPCESCDCAKALPTYPPTYVLIYLPTYLPTYLSIYARQHATLTRRRVRFRKAIGKPRSRFAMVSLAHRHTARGHLTGLYIAGP